jgi:hypothetical protein
MAECSTAGCKVGLEGGSGGGGSGDGGSDLSSFAITPIITIILPNCITGIAMGVESSDGNGSVVAE